MREIPRTIVLRYGGALLVVALATFLTIALREFIFSATLLLFLLACVLAAWYGGLRPALLATIVSAVAYAYLLAPPLHSFQIGDADDWVRLGLFVVVSVILSWLIEALRNSEREADARASELQVSEERFRRVLDTAQEGIWMVDALANTSYVNSGMAEMLGYAAEEIMGRPLWEYMEAASRKDAERSWDRRTEQLSEKHDIRFRRKDGSTLWALVTTSPIRDARGEVEGALAMVTDITERKRAEEALRFIVDASQVLASSLEYESTLRSVARLAVPALADWSAVDIIEDDGTIRRLAMVHTDHTKEEMAWQFWKDHRPNPDDPEGLMMVLRTGRPALYADIPALLSDGTVTDPSRAAIYKQLGIQSGLIVPLRARGRTLGAMSLATAESGRRYGPADLTLAETLARRATLAVDNALLYREAQREIDERKQAAQEILKLAEELRRANRAKDEFLAMLAHELRNPLAPLVNALHILHLHGSREEIPVRARDVAERQAKHMARLIDDLLDVSRITRGKIQLRKGPVELATLVNQAVETSRPLVEERRHQLSVSLPDEPIWFEVDATRLEQVLANLLNNAAKYTEEGGGIWLTAQREGDQAVIRVRDTGIGIRPDMLPGIFDLFVQADRALDRSQGGLGIGLTLVRRLVEMHDGTVEAASGGPGKGSEFTVRLPLLPTAPSQAAPQTSSLQSSNGQCLRVLVVDDNVDAAQSLAWLLSSYGHEVATADDGTQALEKAQTFQPQAVLLDIGLPRMDGLEVARRLRQQPGLEKTLLIALTGYGQEDDLRRSLEAGFDRHLVKPVDPAIVANILSESRQTTDADGT